MVRPKHAALVINKQNLPIGESLRDDFPQEYRSEIIRILISEKLICFCDGFEKLDHDYLSRLSSYDFLRTCNCLRRCREEIPDVIHFGRTEDGKLIIAIITKEFKVILRYDEAIRRSFFI